ncbi:MAG: cupin domain-containing protein [Limisphaerales bacterium]
MTDPLSPPAASTPRRYQIARLESLPPIDCPCGDARRAFAVPGQPASVHLVNIHADAARHYHRRTTEIYVVLEGEGEIELDDEVLPLSPLTTVLIQPGCRHRARGRLRILNFAVPAFDPTDEFFD